MAVEPIRVGDITAAWLTEALADALDGGVVTDVRAEDIGTGVGVFGTIARLHLSARGAPAGFPATLVAKGPTDAEANRAVAMALRLYEREGRFYERFAPTAPFRSPRCFASLTDVQSGRFLLLIEDLGHLEAGDQLAGLTPARAARLIGDMAAFHATWWESPELDALDWLPHIDDPIYQAAVPPIVTAGAAALPRHADRLPPGSVDLAQRLEETFADLVRRCAALPRTVVHGDLRLDNVFFVPGTDDSVLIDFQLPFRANGLQDIMWLLSTSMDVDEQRSSAESLLRGYHSALSGHGVVWPWDDLRQAAALRAAYLISGPFSLIGTLEFADVGDGRSAALTKVWLERAFHLAFLLGADELL